jgi:hypothetical protein
MTPAVSVCVGILGAAALVALARGLAPGRELLVFAIGLGVTGLAYVLFGLALGAPGAHMAREAVGAAIFVGAAVLGLRRPTLLAIGWTAHALWDLSFHYAPGATFAPAWYAMFCVGFDLPVGGYIAGLLAARRP